MNHKTMKPIIPRGEKLELKIFRTFLFIMTEFNVLVRGTEVFGEVRLLPL